MLGYELVKDSIDEYLKSDALYHIAKEDQIVTLADRWYVVLFNGRGSEQVTHEHLVDPEQILALFIVTFVRELTAPVELFDTELHR